MKAQDYKDLDALPSNLRVYMASDYATLDPEPGKKEPDFTEHGVVGIDAIGDMWMLDWWYMQVSTDKGINAFCNLVQRWKPVRAFNEGGLIDKAIKPAIIQSMRLRNTWVALESLPSMADKTVKLQSFHARASAGTVHFPARRAWTDHVIDQLVKFPGGRWDDAADVCGLLGRGIDKMFEASLPAVERRPLLVPFSEAWLTYNDRADKPKVRYFS